MDRRNKKDKKEYIQEVYCIHKAAARGDTEAQFNLGNLYLFGVGVKQNISKATIWVLRAATQG